MTLSGTFTGTVNNININIGVGAGAGGAGASAKRLRADGADDNEDDEGSAATEDDDDAKDEGAEDAEDDDTGDGEGREGDDVGDAALDEDNAADLLATLPIKPKRTAYTTAQKDAIFVHASHFRGEQGCYFARRAQEVGLREGESLSPHPLAAQRHVGEEAPRSSRQ